MRSEEMTHDDSSREPHEAGCAHLCQASLHPWIHTDTLWYHRVRRARNQTTAGPEPWGNGGTALGQVSAAWHYWDRTNGHARMSRVFLPAHSSSIPVDPIPHSFNSVAQLSIQSLMPAPHWMTPEQFDFLTAEDAKWTIVKAGTGTLKSFYAWTTRAFLERWPVTVDDKMLAAANGIATEAKEEAEAKVLKVSMTTYTILTCFNFVC